VNPQRVINVSETGALIAATAGDLLSQTDPTFPRPRVIVGILMLYGILSLVAGLGRGPARFAAASGFVAFLTSLVVGPAGKHLIDLLHKVTILQEGA
jgi:hypothetical protein